MKIAVEALGIHYVGGGRTATLNLLEPLFGLDTQNKYTVLLSQPEPSLQTPSGNVRQWIAPYRNRFLLRLWAQSVLPWALRGYDLTHFVKNLGVFGVPTRKVVTVYDLTILLYPDIYPAFDVWYWRTLEKYALHAANRIIAISETTARDLVHYYRVTPKQLRVIYPGPGPHFHPATTQQIIAARARYGLPEDYIIFVGHLDKKKNLTTLVAAFAQLRRKLPGAIKLVLAGEEYPKTRDLALYAMVEQLGLREQVVFTGRLPDADVPILFSGALLAAFPSLHEGFGLSPLEAMASGVPLVTSPAGAVIEVVDAAAFVVTSPEPEAWAEALFRVASDEALQAELRRRGLERARQFSSAETARRTLALYEEVMST